MINRISATSAALAAFAIAASTASAANYWKGVDGADLADPANWSDNVLPTDAACYFNGHSEHGKNYTASLSQDVSFYQLNWGGNDPKVESTVFDLGRHTLTLNDSRVSNGDIRISTDGVSVTVTNGTLTVGVKAWLLGDNQTLTFGKGAVFNGYAALHASAARSGNKIVVKDGARVNGRLVVSQYQTDGEILVTGEGTLVDYGGGVLCLGGSSVNTYNGTFRVSDGAVVTNAVVAFGNNAYRTSGGTIAVESGAKLFTSNWDISGGNPTYVMQYQDYDPQAISIGDGALYCTRTLNIVGTNNLVSIDNGTLIVAKVDAAGTNTFHFAGASPKLDHYYPAGPYIRERTTFSFDVPAGGYASAPADFYPGAAFTMPDTTLLVINATEYAKAGGGTVPLMAFRGSRAITFSQTLLDRWNTELAGRATVAWDATNRQLTCTVASLRPTLMLIR